MTMERSCGVNRLVRASRVIYRNESGPFNGCLGFNRHFFSIISSCWICIFLLYFYFFQMNHKLQRTDREREKRKERIIRKRMKKERRKKKEPIAVCTSSSSSRYTWLPPSVEPSRESRLTESLFFNLFRLGCLIFY